MTTLALARSSILLKLPLSNQFKLGDNSTLRRWPNKRTIQFDLVGQPDHFRLINVVIGGVFLPFVARSIWVRRAASPFFPAVAAVDIIAEIGPEMLMIVK